MPHFTGFLFILYGSFVYDHTQRVERLLCYGIGFMLFVCGDIIDAIKEKKCS